MVRMIVDSDSSVYIGANSYSTGTAGNQDALLIKMDSTYTQQWGMFYGGSGNDGTGDIDISTNGIYIAGYTNTPAMTNGGYDIFILKLSKTDGSKGYSKLFGSTSDEYATSISVSSGYIYVGAYSSSTGWTNAGTDFVIFKLDESTGSKQWAKYYGGPNNEILTDMLIIGSVIYGIGYGDIGIAGDDFLSMSASTTDGTLATFSYLGGATNSETSSRLKVDSSGFLYLLGGSSSSGLTHGFADIIFMKVNPSTNSIVWGVYAGSSTNNDYGTDLVISSDGTSVYVLGYTDATGITFGSNDILMIKASSSTGANQFVVHCGGNIQDYGRTLYVEANSKILIGGDTTSSGLSTASTSDILIFEIDSQGRNQCSNLQRGDITGTLASNTFSTTTFSFKSYTPSSGTITDNVRTTSGDTITSSATAFSDVCSNYYPIIAEEGLTTPQYAYQDVVFTTTLTEFCDTTGKTITYSLLQSDGTALPTWMTFTASTRVLTGIPLSTSTSTSTLTYTATDNTGSSGTASLVIKIDKKPVLTNAIADQSARTGTVYTYTIPSNTFVDPDSDPITYTCSSVPSWATYTSSTRILTGTPATTDVGSVDVTVICTDSFGGASTTTMKINVIGNIAPVVQNSIPDQKVPVGTTYSYTFAANTFYDGNGDTMTYTMTGNPSWLSLDATNRIISGTPPTDYAYNITIKASDGYGGSASDVYLLVLGNGIPNNSPVVAKSIPDQSTTTYADYTYTISSGTFTDADGDNLALTTSQNSGSSLPSWLVFTSTTWTFGGKPTTSDIGSYVIKVVASDGKGGSCSTTFTIAVSSYSSTALAIAIILIVVIVILFIIVAIIVTILIIKKRKLDKQREVESNSSSDDEDDEIIDKTGALTQFLVNTHKLEGSKFIPNPKSGAIYQKKSLDVLFTPQEPVKKFLKEKYGLDYDHEKGMFTTTNSVFAAGLSTKKSGFGGKYMYDNIQEEDKEDDEEFKEGINPSNLADAFGEVRGEILDEENADIRPPTIMTKKKSFKGTKKSSLKKKKSTKSLKGKRAKSKSPKVKGSKINGKGKKRNAKSPKAKSTRSKSPKSPKTKKSTKSVKSLKSAKKSEKLKSVKSVKSSKSVNQTKGTKKAKGVKNAKSPKAQKSPKASKSPKSPKSPKVPKSPKSPKSSKSPKAPKSPKALKSPKAPKSPKSQKGGKKIKKQNTKRKKLKSKRSI